jgi:hypothetical protein
MSRLAFKRCPPSIPKKKHLVAVFSAFSSSIFLCFEKKGKSIGVLVEVLSCAYFDSRCHGYGGTSMRYMRVDSSTGHRCQATQFQIAASDIVGRFRTPHA